MAKPIYEDDVSEEEQVSPAKRTISKPVYEDDSSIEDQIRSAAAERAANRASPTMPAYEETPISEKTAAKVPMRPGQSISGAKQTPIITKEQLGGMSLRDYLNQQQGLKPRGESTRTPTRPGQESPTYSNEGKNKPSPSKPLMGSDRDNASAMSVNERIKKSLANAREGSGPTDSRSVNQRIKEALGMKKGGAVKKMASGGSVSSASRRADGIATKGKTRGRIC